MLAKRIIPTLLCNGRQLIKGEKFNSWRSVGAAAQAVRIHQMRGVDELILLDICATKENRGPDLKLVEELSEKCFMPLTVGGGVRKLEDIRNLLQAGADKVSICTKAFEDESFIQKASNKFGSQAIVIAMDVRDSSVTIRNGTEKTPENVVESAVKMENMGAGEILLTNVSKEGTMEGYDLKLIEEVTRSVNIPVIANGGCSGYEDMYQAIKHGADAVAIGALFQFTDCTPKEAAEYLDNKGVCVRL